MNPFRLRLSRVSLIYLACVFSVQASAVCLFWCETPQEKIEREGRELARAEKIRQRENFLKFHEIGTKKAYVYSEEQLKKDAAEGWQLILVVDRGASGQTLKIYDGTKLIDTWAVSTGLEDYKPLKYGQKRFAHTPVGRFLPLSLHAKYRSKIWDEDMPFTVFFTADGVAFHAAKSKAAQEKIGRRASAGCVRLKPNEAELLFELIKRNRETTLIVVEDGGAG